MDKKRTQARRSGQVNVQISSEEEDVLHALAYLENASRAEVLTPIVARFLKKQASRQDVIQAIEARKLNAPAERRVARLEDARRRREGRAR